MRIEANLFEVKEKQNLPGGTYNAVIEAPKQIDKAKTGREMMVFQFKIIDPVGADYWDNLKFFMVKQDTIGWATMNMKQLAEAAGVHYDPAGFDTDDFNGKQVKIVVEQEIYNDKIQNKIVHFLKP